MDYFMKYPYLCLFECNEESPEHQGWHEGEKMMKEFSLLGELSL